MSGGFILSCIAGPENIHIKTFLNDSEIDKAVKISFKDLNIPLMNIPLFHRVLTKDNIHLLIQNSSSFNINPSTMNMMNIIIPQ